MGPPSKCTVTRCLRIGLALACPFLAWALQQWLWDIGVHLPILLFYPTVIASALIGVCAYGVVATFVVAGIDVWAFVEPRGSWSIAHAIDLVTTSIFVATGLVFSWLVA